MVQRQVQLALVLLTLALIPAASAAASQRIYLGGNGPGPSNVGAFDLGRDGGIGAVILGSSALAGDGIEGMAMSPDGRSLYVSGHGAGLFGYSVGANGALTPTDAIPETDRLADIVSTPDGRFLFAGTLGSGAGIHAFARAPDGTLTPTDSGIPTGDASGVLAMAPGGRHLFVADSAALGSLRSYAIGADGRLTLVGSVPGNGGSALAVAPDGRHLYEVTPDGTRAFAVAADGSLAELGSPVPGGTGDAVDGVVSPNGTRLYVSYSGNQTIAAYGLGADGAPAPIGGSPAPVGSGVMPGALAIDASGSHLYVTDQGGGRTAGFSIDGAGLPAPLPASPFATGFSGGHGTSVIAPDQPPVAAFTTTVNNRRITFDATASTDPDGDIARYDWDFSGGHLLPDGGITTTQRFGKRRPLTTLTVTDDAGCSTAFVSAGHTPYCNGSALAQTSMVPFAPKFLGKPMQKATRNVRLKLRCPVECRVKVVGRLKFSGKGVRAKKAKLKGETTKLKADRAKTLKLKIPERAVLLSKLSTRAVARLKVSVTDDAGDLFKERHGIRLR